MAKSAYVLLNADGSVGKTHSPDIAGNSATDVETLITAGYLQKREVVLDGGKVLLVMEKP